MMSLYELYNKKAKYNAIRENVNNAINVLSRVNISDSFDTAISSLESNYVVNDIPCKKNDLRNIRQSVANDLNNLRSILSAINVKINSINREIQELEMAQNM